MKSIRYVTLFAFLFVLSLTLSQNNLAQIAVKGETIYTMNGAAIKDGVVVIKDGKISAVGNAASTKIPAGYKVLTAKVVTPGLIDAHTVIGLAGYLNQPHDQMQIETSSPMQPELRAIDAYNPREELVSWVRSLGVTTIHTGHAPAALISGQTLIAKTAGNTVDEAVVIPFAMVAATIGNGARGSGGKSPGTIAKEASMLRGMLIKARAYDEKKKGSRDLRMETLVRVLKREIPLLVTAQRATDIMTAIRIAKEFNIKIVLDGVAEAQSVIEEIKASGFPVIIHPTMMRASGDTRSLSMEDAAKLINAGIPVALQSGYETYVPKTRVVLFEAAITLQYGLNFEQALSTITTNAAKVLGLEKRIGSLEVGKDADIAMYDGDPFEYTTHAIGTIVDGKLVSEEIR